MARVRECHPAHVWAYFNNDRDAHAIRNAETFLHRLGSFEARLLGQVPRSRGAGGTETPLVGLRRWRNHMSLRPRGRRSGRLVDCGHDFAHGRLVHHVS